MDSKLRAELIKSMPDSAAPAFTPVAPDPAAVEEEARSALALGLPQWDLEPPQVAVRKRGSKL